MDRRDLRSRNRSLRPYGHYRLFDREIPSGNLPVGVPYVSDFVPLTLGLDPPEQVLLNVYCTSGQVSLDGPDRCHGYQVQVR